MVEVHHVRREFTPQMVEEGIHPLLDYDICNPGPSRSCRFLPVPGQNLFKKVHYAFCGKEGGEHGAEHRMMPPLPSDAYQVTSPGCRPGFRGTDAYAVTAVDAFVTGEDGQTVCAHDNGPFAAGLGAEPAADTAVLVEFRRNNSLKAHIVHVGLEAIDGTAGKTDLEFVIIGRSAEQLLVHFQGRSLGIHQAIGIVLATAAGSRHTHPRPARSDCLSALGQILHDPVKVLEPGMDHLHGLAYR